MVRPDIEVINARITPVEERGLTREADLEGHLEGQKKQPEAPSASRLTSPEDYAVNEALNLLKGLNIFAETKQR